MADPSLLTDLRGPDAGRFAGADVDQATDGHRLQTQLERIEAHMADGHWRSVDMIARVLDIPANSVQAQLRNLRKVEFGSYEVESRQKDGGATYYRVGAKGAGTPQPKALMADDTVRDVLAAADGLIGFLEHHAGCAATGSGGKLCNCGFVSVRAAWLTARTASRKAGL